MSNEDLDLYTAVFAEFMTPEEDGTPILLHSDLKYALEAVGIPKELSKDLKPLMDPENTGKITFEHFFEVCLENGNQINSKEREVFDLVSDKGKITVETLRDVADKLKLQISESDLIKLVEIAHDEKSFKELWNILGDER